MVQLEREKPRKTTGKDIVFSVLLHVVVLGALAGRAILFHKGGERWGDAAEQAGAVQATMVNSLPLPPKVQPKQDSVLASESPSVAPPPPSPRAEPPPRPTDLAVVRPPEKVFPKPADRSAPDPPRHPQPVKPQPDLAASGETAGLRVAMTSVENRVGTSSTNVTDSAFGERYAFYVRQMTQKISQQWFTQTLSPGAQGRHVSITFRVERDGTPGEIRIGTPSGDTSLDSSALRALQRIDTFGPLPEGYGGSYISVRYLFEPKQ